MFFACVIKSCILLDWCSKLDRLKIVYLLFAVAEFFDVTRMWKALLAVVNSIDKQLAQNLPPRRSLTS